MENKDKQDSGITFAPPAAPVLKRKPGLKKVAILAVAGLLVLGGIVSLFASGYVRVVVGERAATIASNKNVCSIETINKYNSIVNDTSIDAQDLASINKRINDFATEVGKKNWADSDPSCLYFQYIAAIRSDDQDKARGYVETIKKLSDDGVFVDSRISGVTGIEQMEASVKALVPSEDGLYGSG